MDVYIEQETRLECSRAERNLGIFGGKINMNQQWSLVVAKANPTLGCIEYGRANQTKKVIVLLYAALLQPHLKYCVQVWGFTI